MKKFIKILTLFSITLLSAVVLLLAVSAILEPQVSIIFMQKINRSLNTRADVGSINFSLLKSFPRASIELRDLVIYTPEGININEFNLEGKDTLLSAGKLFVSLKITGLLRKEYIIDRLTVDHGRIMILQDSERVTNLNILKGSQGADSAALAIELSNIRIINSSLRVVSIANNTYADIFITEGTNRLSLSPLVNRVEVNTKFKVNELKSNRFVMPSGSRLFTATSAFSFSSQSVVIDNFSLSQGDLAVKASGQLDRSTDLLSARFILPSVKCTEIVRTLDESFATKLFSYSINGKAEAVGTMEGKIIKGNLPLLKADISLSDGSFSLPERRITFKDINATGMAEFNPDDFARSLSLRLETFSATGAGSSLSGYAYIRNIHDPEIDISLSGDLESSGIISLLTNPGFEANGVVRTNLRIYGKLPHKEKYLPADLLSLSRSVNMNFRSVNILFPGSGLKAEKLKGNLMVADNLWFDGITFTLEDSEVAMNGRITGAENFLPGNNGNIIVTAGIWSDRFDTEIISRLTTDKANKTSDTDRKSISGRLAVNMDIRLDSLIVGNFRSSMLSSEVNYSNKFINISSFSLSALGGGLSGNAAIALLSTGRYLGKGWFDITSIDIRETFSVFNNFRQQYITDKNLQGRLTGTLNITSELDSLFRPDINSLDVSGNYLIRDGELIAFEPVLKLSRFVELSELQDIKFSELKNDIVIKNRSVGIPSMDIKSSAFDLSVSGNHSLDGLYTYHLRLLMSDLMSRRAREKNAGVSEFGVIENDNLGKTSLYLKIEGSRDGSKVSWDMKNMKGDIKKDVGQEKVNLKTILREEYGWYSNDSVPPVKKEETRKFRIVWEEADSIRKEEPVDEEKIVPLKNILRKKKKSDQENN